jgi:hypothetical protein
MSSYLRVKLAQDEGFQFRVLMLALAYAQDVMNIEVKPEEMGVQRLQMKAQELLNQPDTFKERLAFSVAARLGAEFLDPWVEDDTLDLLIPDVFDGLAGVKQGSAERPNRVDIPAER